MKHVELDKRVQLLFSDVDKTILTSDHTLPDAVKAAFRSIQRSGVKVVLATGRSPKGAAPIARSLGVDHAICFNGGWVGNLAQGSATHTTKLDRTVALAVMAVVANKGLSGLWYADEGVFTAVDNDAARLEAKITGETLNIVDGPHQLPGHPYKVMIVRRDRDPAGFDEIRSRFSGECSVVMSDPRLLEVMPLFVNKGDAAVKLANSFKVGCEACAAAGDAENDLTIINWVGTPLTTANAIDEILSVAKFIGPSADQGGMAVVLEWLEAANSSFSREIS
jgi:Cof subfamily protein (haloacid dehalogenase superfamily)